MFLFQMICVLFITITFYTYLANIVFSCDLGFKLTVPLLCVCVNSAWKGRPQNDLYCFGWDVKPYSLTHSLTCASYCSLAVSAVSGGTFFQKSFLFLLHNVDVLYITQRLMQNTE